MSPNRYPVRNGRKPTLALIRACAGIILLSEIIPQLPVSRAKPVGLTPEQATSLRVPGPSPFDLKIGGIVPQNAPICQAQTHDLRR